MRIVILHNWACEDSGVDQRDVLVQRDAVAAAISMLGHDVDCLDCTLDLSVTAQRLGELAPDLVFNLVESLGGTDRLMPLATILLDAFGIPYTGSNTEAILATTNKMAAKQRLSLADLPTPAWFTADHADDHSRIARVDSVGGTHVIVKPVWEHASFGMDDGAVVALAEVGTARHAVLGREHATGRPHFAEAFIDGREFNLSLLAASYPPDAIVDPVALPPAEIDFSAFPDGKPRIVGHSAKWDQNSLEYQRTPRRFDFPSSDKPLLRELRHLARQCWQLFGLNGYARVDFRVDSNGQPWILEVNANPCLAPDAGFAAALDRAGIGFASAIDRIVQDAIGLRSCRIIGPHIPRSGECSP